MRMVTCGECKKRYDFDQDDFCPRCGAFNPPQKQWTVDYYGNVVRVDGINERNHTGSFVHKEVHREKAVRRLKGLDRGGVKLAAKPRLKSNKSSEAASGIKYILERALATLIALLILLLTMLGTLYN